MLILIKELGMKTQNPRKKCYRYDWAFSTKHIKESKALKAQCINNNIISPKVSQQKNVNHVNNTKEQEDVTQEITEMEAY